jgi:hypothetical protein
MPVDSHLILDIGPGLLSLLTALLVATPGMAAAYYSFRSKQAIDQANSHLATALNLNSNAAGESKLTISAIPVVPGKV